MKRPYSETGQIIVDVSCIETWGNLSTANLNILSFKNMCNMDFEGLHKKSYVTIPDTKADPNSHSMTISPLFVIIMVKNEDTSVL